MCSVGGRHRYPPPSGPTTPFRIPAGLCPQAGPPSLRFPLCQPAGHPMVESTQHPPNAWCHDPHLWPIKHYRLHHHQVHLDRGPGIHPLSTHHPSQYQPLNPWLLQVAYHRWLVVVLRRENPSKIFERGDLGKGNPIYCECHLSPRPCLLLHQTMLLPLHYLPAERRLHVPAVEGLVWHNNITLGEHGVGSVTFLQDHYWVPRVAVQKVNLEVGMIRSPSQAPLYWSPEPTQTFSEIELVSLGLPRGGFPPPVPPRSTPCWLWKCVSSNPAATTTPHSRHATLCRCQSRMVGPVPIVRRS